MVNCCAPNCRAITGHLFPKDPHLKKKWLDFVQKTSVGAYAIVCKAHFTEDDFTSKAVIDGLPTPRARLKPDAVPSIRKPAPYAPPPFKTVKRRLTSHEKAAYLPKHKYKYAKLSTSAEKVYQTQVRAMRVAILTDPQMIRLLENIKKKFMHNAPTVARFPRHWTNPSLVKKTRRIRDGFPPFSMPCLVTMAIESTPTRFATKLQILAFISKNFPCYKLGNNDWQNNVSQTIDMYKFFRKVPIKESPNPQMTYYTFSPSQKYVLSTEVYEAFTDPRYDESKIDSAHAVMEADSDAISVADEDVEHDSIVDFIEQLDQLSQDDGSLSDDGDDSEQDSDGEEVENKKFKPSSLSVWEILSCDEDDEISDIDRSEDSSDDTPRLPPAQESSRTLFKCCFCKFTSGNNRVTAEHLLVAHLNGVVYCCQHCDYVASSSDMLESHKSAKHSDIVC